MTKTPDIAFDPTRLLALDLVRRDARARQRGAADRYNELREKRQDAEGRAARLRQRATENGPDGRASAIEQAEKIEAEVKSLTRQLADAQAEGDAHGTELSRAGTLLTQCFMFAVEAGMSIPPELAADAERAVRSGAI